MGLHRKAQKLSSRVPCQTSSVGLVVLLFWSSMMRFSISCLAPGVAVNHKVIYKATVTEQMDESKCWVIDLTCYVFKLLNIKCNAFKRYGIICSQKTTKIHTHYI